MGEQGRGPAQTANGVNCLGAIGGSSITGFVLLRYETATMWLNGGSEVPSDYGAFQFFRLMGHLPALIHPDLRDILVIGFGGAMAPGAVSLHGADQKFREAMQTYRKALRVNPGELTARFYSDVLLDSYRREFGRRFGENMSTRGP